MEKNKNEKWDHLVKAQKSQSTQDNILKNPDQINSYFFIFDCFENVILFTNSAFKTVTNYEVQNFDLNFLLNIIHPDDINYFLLCEEKFLDFTNKLNFNEHFKFIHSYSYRIKTNNGEYIRILQECQALEVNESGHLTKTLVNHKKIEYSENPPTNDIKIYDKSQNTYIDAENRFNLTKRELEILELIKEGLNSQQISNLLKISKNTIITHRKNILNKSTSKSFIELIKKINYSL